MPDGTFLTGFATGLLFSFLIALFYAGGKVDEQDKQNKKRK